MGQEIDLLINYPKAKRNLEERVNNKTEEDREIARITNNKVYQLYTIKKFKPSLRQMEEIFRVNLYITGSRRKSIINKTVNLCMSDGDLYKFLIKNKNILMKGNNKWTM